MRPSPGTSTSLAMVAQRGETSLAETRVARARGDLDLS